MYDFKPLLKSAVTEHLDTAVDLKQYLYDHPELPYKEVLSSKEIVRILRAAGYVVEYPFMSDVLGYDTAFQGVLDCGDGPSVAILVEYDALPELGHGCGHNFHGAASVLAALAMPQLKEHFSGKVYVIGTPAEEENGAKVKMAEHGIFDNMSVASMLHTWSGGVSYPQMELLALRCYIIEFFGTESHASAAPWDGHNAFTAARKCLDLIDARRECFTPDLRVNGIITDGGKTPNILPAYAAIRLELRAGSAAKLEQTDDLVKRCAKGAAMALDCDVTFKSGLDDFFDMVRVSSLENVVSHWMEELDIPCEAPTVGLGSSDMGNVSYHCPSIQALLSVTDEKYPLHTTQLREATMTTEARDTLARGGELIAGISLQMLIDAELRETVQKEFVVKKQAKNNL